IAAGGDKDIRLIESVGAFDGLRDRQYSGDLIGMAVHLQSPAAERRAAAETFPEGAADDDLRGAITLVAGMRQILAESEARTKSGEEVLGDFYDVANLAA